jgi:hypothetical protein
MRPVCSDSLGRSSSAKIAARAGPLSVGMSRVLHAPLLRTYYMPSSTEITRPPRGSPRVIFNSTAPVAASTARKVPLVAPASNTLPAVGVPDATRRNYWCIGVVVPEHCTTVGIYSGEVAEPLVLRLLSCHPGPVPTKGARRQAWPPAGGTREWPGHHAVSSSSPLETAISVP